MRHPIRTVRQLFRPPGTWRKKALNSYLPKDAVIVEAGAHRGTDTVDLARIVPEGQVHAFEPIPDLYEHLKRATADYPNVTTYPLALGDRTTVAPMYFSGGTHDASSSLLAPKEHLKVFPEITFDEMVEVKVTTIAAWAEREGIESIDAMWLDMQGYELAALKAAGPILTTTRAIILEVFRLPLYAGSPPWPEVRDWLETQGFRVETEDLGDAFGDALVVRQ